VDAGDPVEIAKRYNEEGADELCFLDITASHLERDTIVDVVERVARELFIPLTVGGGIRTIDDISRLLNVGCDKISLNSAAIKNPNLIDEAAFEAEKFAQIQSVNLAQILGDFVVWKKDHTPAYNLASLVDDEILGVNLLVRGEDLLACSAAQKYMAQMLGYGFESSNFIHHGLLAHGGKKLSKKSEKLEKIAQGAAEQSKRNLIPEIRLFDKKADFLAALAAFDRIIVAYEESAKEGESAALVRALSGLPAGAKVLFIFGPEGGLSPEEIASFGQAGAVSAGLGPRILRAETAPLYALTAVSVLLELSKDSL